VAEGVQRQSQQTWLFFGESLSHGAGAIVGPAALLCHFIAPRQRLSIALCQGSEGTSCPERIPYVPNGPFDPASGEKRALQTVIIMAQKFSQSRILSIR